MHWKTVYNSVHCYLLVFQNLHFTPPLPIGGGRFGMGAKPQGVWGTEVPQKLKNFLSSYKQILRIFGSISHIFTYICRCFFRVCRHHSTKSAKWGHLIPFPPLSASGGHCPSHGLRRLCPLLQLFSTSYLSMCTHDTDNDCTKNKGDRVKI